MNVKIRLQELLDHGTYRISEYGSPISQDLSDAERQIVRILMDQEERITKLETKNDAKPRGTLPMMVDDYVTV